LPQYAVCPVGKNPGDGSVAVNAEVFHIAHRVAVLFKNPCGASFGVLRHGICKAAHCAQIELEGLAHHRAVVFGGGALHIEGNIHNNLPRRRFVARRVNRA
jgi:hypothetical protein